MSITEAIMDIPAAHQQNIFGRLDMNVKKIERALPVTIVSRGDGVHISGGAEAVAKAQSVLTPLLELSVRGNPITEQNVDYTISMTFSEKHKDILEIDKDII